MWTQFILILVHSHRSLPLFLFLWPSFGSFIFCIASKCYRLAASSGVAARELKISKNGIYRLRWSERGESLRRDTGDGREGFASKWKWIQFCGLPVFWICSGGASYRTDIININAILIPIRKMGPNQTTEIVCTPERSGDGSGDGGGSDREQKKKASKMYIHNTITHTDARYVHVVHLPGSATFSPHVLARLTPLCRCLCCTFYRSHMANTAQAWNYLPNSLYNVFIRSIWYENTSQIPLSKWFQMPEKQVET